MTSIQVSKSKVFCFHCTEPSTFLVSRLVSSSTNTKPYLNQSVQSEAVTLEAAPGWRLVSVSSVAAPRSVVLCTPGLSVLCCCSVTTTTIDPPRSSCWSPSWLDSSCSSTPATPWQRWRSSISWSWSGRPGRSSHTSTGERWPYDRTRSRGALSDNQPESVTILDNLNHNHQRNQNIIKKIVI